MRPRIGRVYVEDDDSDFDHMPIEHPSDAEDASNLAADGQMKREVKVYESQYNENGRPVLKAVDPDKKDINVADKGLYAMRYYRYYNRDGTLVRVVLKIFSSHIQKALRTVIKSYSTQNFTGLPVILEGHGEEEALGCLYHYRNELKGYGKTADCEGATLDIQLVLKLVDEELKAYIERYETNVLTAEHPCVAFSDIWMIFRPGELLFTGADAAETERILEIVGTAFHEAGWGKPASWVVEAKCFAFNGLQGDAAQRRLDLQPLEYHPDQAALRARQIARGEKLCRLAGVHHCQYSGPATAVEHRKKPSPFGGCDVFTHHAVTVSGRVMIDHLTYIKHRTREGVAFNSEAGIDADAVTENDHLRSHYQMPGFALLEKRWCWFRVDLVTDVAWDADAFDLLMLPASQKRILRALTWQHTGKGKGCVFLLHGAPGIGKTFTVESIAEVARRPLYVMMSGELGTDMETVERHLKRVLELAMTWKAVLLIDEADVFLERRSSHDLARNGIVSIFLRVLEYYAGIMFLATNRVQSFDEAFQSRIHLALKYHPLDAAGRADLWRLFLQRTAGYKESSWPAVSVDEFAAMELNGRQIKNTARTANTLALAEGKTLSVEHVREVLRAVGEFDFVFQ
ncbi:ATPase, AAA family protein [Akanthomyces lecanii RCEF 1005]|uniref:ATPase, AAA family protein n=1 Tax=Akanthomyces lecanii RCEF 1005 TaxID=1081108 RepID=A0A162KKG0_CORDF|nr:ATPase, AAA family protein [Akanthomyces lecanii RCEF 1005]